MDIPIIILGFDNLWHHIYYPAILPDIYATDRIIYSVKMAFENTLLKTLTWLEDC